MPRKSEECYKCKSQQCLHSLRDTQGAICDVCLKVDQAHGHFYRCLPIDETWPVTQVSQELPPMTLDQAVFQVRGAANLWLLDNPKDVNSDFVREALKVLREADRKRFEAEFPK